MKLEMDLYANKKYKLMYTFYKKPDSNGRLIKNFYYEVDNNNYIISTMEDPGYKLHIIENSNKEEVLTLTIPTTKNEMRSITAMPRIYDYFTSKNKTDKDFSITFKIDEKEFSMNFDKKYYVAYNDWNRVCEVFGRKADGIIDTKKKIEEYVFTNTGYLYINYEDMRLVYTFFDSNDIIESDYIEISSKDCNPIDILFENVKNKYKISYDDYKIMKSMLYANENTHRQEYCRYEKVESEGSPYISSLHPLIIDLFDYFYIDKDIFKYWVIDKYEVGKENEDDIFIREVYEIKDAESLEQLINIINSDIITSPILS